MPPRVMIIDDERNFVDWMSEVLFSIGHYTVIAALTGRDGVARAVRETPDVILLDVMMPDLDGFDVLRALKDTPSTMSIPVIMLTALNSHEARMQALHLYCEGYIEKPCTGEVVIQCINSVLERRRELQKRFSRGEDEPRASE